MDSYLIYKDSHGLRQCRARSQPLNPAIRKLAALAISLIFTSSCADRAETAKGVQRDSSQQTAKAVRPERTPIPPTLSEILDNKNSQSSAPIGKFDFTNYTYPLPRGWEDADSKEITLTGGIRRLTEEKIGMKYVTRKFGDVTGDGENEAFVILAVETGGSAMPQIVYIFKWSEDKPELIWYFRTGDRADGGLKRVWAEDGELWIDLFGRDRYIFAQMETSKIVDDEQRICCPSHFTRTRYKRSGNDFVLQGDRLTYSLTDKEAAPEKNMNEIRLREERGKKK